MSKPAKNGAEPVVEIATGVMRAIRQHARSSIKTEVCGVLIGDHDAGRVRIHASIAGMNASQGGAHVTFTQETWEHIYQIKDREYPDDRIAGWYHSHPAFGIFLSEHDLFIQENFFSSPLQIAWVYDPVSDEEGCFGWVGGKIERLNRIVADDREERRGTFALKEESGDQDDLDWSINSAEAPPSRKTTAPNHWVRWTNLTLSHLAMLLLGVAAMILMSRLRTEKPFVTGYVHGVEDCVNGRVVDLPLEHGGSLRQAVRGLCGNQGNPFPIPGASGVQPAVPPNPPGSKR